LGIDIRRISRARGPRERHYENAKYGEDAHGDPYPVDPPDSWKRRLPDAR